MSLNWSTIQDVLDADCPAHAGRAAALGLNCSLDVFEQLFQDHTDDAEMAGFLRFVNWADVTWEEGALSGVDLHRRAALLAAPSTKPDTKP